MHKGFVLICFLFLFPLWASAQEHTPFQPEHYWQQLADDQFQKGQFEAAAQSARHYLYDQPQQVPDQDIKDRMSYYSVTSMLKRNEPAALDSALHIMPLIHQPALRDRLSLLVAQYYFHKHDLLAAIPYYKDANIANLSNAEIVDAHFELAYCYFSSNRFSEAEPLLAGIKEVSDGKYYNAGNYYYGLLAYNQNNYAAALKSFNRINQLPEYANIVPYYIAEIQYFNGEKEKALTETLRLLRKKEKLYYDKELHLLAGQILFEQGKFSEALPYLEYYYTNSDKVRKEELYELGYSYYKTNSYSKAVDCFKPLSGAKDSLGQTAMYLLGDCYLKTNDKRSARNAFGLCAALTFNKNQQEAATFLNGKLSYELGFYDEAQSALTTLLDEFPHTSFSPEAKTILSDLYARTNNFEMAYNTLKDVNSGEPNYPSIYQRASYGYGLQQLQKGNLVDAMELIDASRNYPQDKALEAGALFWLGEIAYRQQHYEASISLMSQYLKKYQRSMDLQDAQPAQAYLTMGYAAMLLEDYADARGYFSKAQQETGSSKIKSLAALREADAAFMQKDFRNASILYDKVSGGTDGDYAQLQKAILAGLNGKTVDKITMLQNIISSNSPYANDARYELAVSQIETAQYAAAIQTLQPLLTSSNQQAAKAWLKTALANQQLNNSADAVTAYKKVLQQWPGTPESSDAIQALKSFYIESNDPDKYVQLRRELNLPADDAASLDSAYYSAAEAQFADNKWQAASESFSKYLAQYPGGLFATKANFYKAESAYRLKQYDSALIYYKAVLDQPYSDFTASSARQAAVLAYSDSDYNNALIYYQQLRTTTTDPAAMEMIYTGLMRSADRSAQPDLALAYADTLLGLPHIDEHVQEEARLLQARGMGRFNKDIQANALFEQLKMSKNPAIAAESRYMLALSLFHQHKLKEAEDAAGKNISESAGQDYWVVKSYMLLADIAVAQKDYFNARATLESIIKNTNDPVLKAEASQKLDEVKAEEDQQTRLSPE